MGQASITVDILAKVKGWQEELAKIKAEAGKIDLGSTFGKGFEKSFKSLESQVDHMSKNLNQRLTSDSGIDNFSTKIDNIDTQFQNLGRTLQNVTFDQLDLSYITSSLEDLNKALAQAQASLDLKMGSGFTEAVMQARDLKTALERLGEDPATISIEQTAVALKNGIESMKQQIQDADKQLLELRLRLSEVRAEASQVQSTPILAIDDVKAKVEEIAGSFSDYGIGGAVNQSGITTYLDNLRVSLSAVGADLQTEGSKINVALQAVADSKTSTELRANLNTLKAVLQDNKINLSDIGFGSIDSIVKKMTTDNVAALEQARTTLQSKLTELKIPQETIDSLIPNFIDLVKKGRWDDAVALLETQLNEYKDTIKTKAEEIQAEENKLTSSINDTKSARSRAIYTQSTAERALNNDYGDIVKDLQNKNADLEARVKDLESQIANKKSEITSNINKSGSGISKESQKQLEENANAARLYKTELEQVQGREQLIGKIQGVVQRWFSIYAAVRMVSNAIRSVISTVKELDATITEIAIVTKMDQSQLWDQMGQYTTLARKYASSISGVYKVSQLYYQQGLGHSDVMALTEQTLKMARISGLDYAEATDYMTNAVRSFKMEMTEAQRVVDVYSSVAASSATNVTELASAMSKTASSAQAVGSSFESTTAMMAVMIEATRESAENIGSALKSIISRYGELKENKTGIDSEGEEYSLNKVDKALQSVGLSIHDANGEFRDFDEVIMELAEKWDTIDKNTQRYIATVMAGNRQQSRFLALVSSYDRLQELSAEAADSTDAAQLQFLKTLDSVDAKTQQLQTSLQSLYVDGGIEDFYKGVLDVVNNIVKSFTNLPKTFDLPITAILKFGTQFYSLANIVTTVFGLIKARVSTQVKALRGEITSEVATGAAEQENAESAAAEAKISIWQQYAAKVKRILHGITSEESATANTSVINTANKTSKGTGGLSRGKAGAGLALQSIGLAGSLVASSIDVNQNRGLKAVMTGLSSTIQGIGTSMLVGGGIPGLILGGVTALPGIIEGLGLSVETTTEKLTRLGESIQNTNNKKIEAKDNLKTLTDYKKKYEELSKAQYNSEEDKQKFIDLQNEIAESYPQLISSMDAEGNYVLDMVDAYEQLAKAKTNAYRESFIQNLGAELSGLNDIHYLMKNVYGTDPFKDGGFFDTNAYKVYDQLIADQYSGKAKRTVSQTFGNNLSNNMYNTFFDGYDNYNKEMKKYDFKAIGGGLGYSFKPMNAETQSVLNQVWAQFLEQAASGKSLEKAKQALYEHEYTFSQAPYDDYNHEAYQILINEAIKNFDDDIYEHMIVINEALEFQSDLINNKIKASNMEYANMLKQSTGEAATVDASDVQLYAVAKKLSDEYLAYYEANKSRIGKSEVIDGKYVNITEEHITEEYYSDKREQWYNEQVNQLKYLDDEANKIYQNLGNYSEEQIKSQITNKDAQNILLSAFKDNYAKTVKNYGKWAEQIQINDAEIKSQVGDFATQFGPAFLDNIRDNYNTILNNDSLSQATKDSSITELTNMYSAIQGIMAVDSDKGVALLEAVRSADLTSMNGIYALMDVIKNNPALEAPDVLNALMNLSNVIKSNITVEIDTMTNTLVKQVKDFGKVLSNASKGMDLEQALEVAEKLGVTLSDDIFSFKDGKYYINDFNKLSDAYVKQNEQLEAALDARIQELELIVKYSNVVVGEDKQTQVNMNAFDILANLEEEDKKAFETDKIKYLKEHPGLGIVEEEIDNAISLYDTYYSAWQKQKGQEGGIQSFSAYIESELAKAKDNLDETIKYNAYQINALLIQNGKIAEFFQNLGFDADKAESYAADVLSGNFDNLPEEAQAYLNTLWSFIKDSSKGVFDSAVKVLQGEGPQMIQVTEENRALLEKLTGENLEEVTEVLLDSINATDLKKAIRNDGNLTKSQKSSLLKSVYEEEHPDLFSAIEGVLTEGQISYSAAESYLIAVNEFTGDVEEDMRRLGFAYDTLTGTWATNNQAGALIQQQIDKFERDGKLTSTQLKQLNELYAKKDQATNTNQWSEISSAFTDAFDNRDKLTTDMVANLATALGKKYNEVRDALIDNGDGTYTIDYSQLTTYLSEAKNIVGETTYNKLVETVSQIQNDILSSITGAADYSIKGTNNLEQMQEFANEFNKGLDESEQQTVDQLFEYNAELNTFKLSSLVLNGFITRKKQSLIELGMADDEVNAYIADYTKELVNSSVEIMDFLSSTDKSKNSKSYKALWAQLKDWGTLYFNTGKNPYDSTIQSWIDTLQAGGEEAVKLATKIKGEGNLSENEITTIYRNAVENINTSIDQLDAQVGDIVNEHTAMILSAVEYEVEDLGNGQYTIKALPEANAGEQLVTAYLTLYHELTETAGATVADLNSAYAKMLSAAEYDQSRPIEAIENALSMTYEQIGEILAQQGILLETFYADMEWYGAEQIGAGKIRIKDFTKFADRMGWDTNTEEYTAAFKEYNDSLIEYNKHITEEIKGEFDTLINAKVGDEVNLTRMVSEFGEDKITELFESYGATINNGILTITETDAAKRVEIYRKIGQLAVNNGAMLETEFQATMDQISKQNKMDLIDSYKTMIQGYSSISMETIRKYAEATNQNYQDAIDQLGLGTGKADGTYEISLINLKALLDKGKETIGEEVYNQLMAEVATVMDNLVSGISSSASFTTTGTNSQKEMVDFTNEFRKLTKDSSVESKDLFEYNDALGAFILKSDKFYEYLRAQSQELKNLGMTEDEISTYLTNEALNLVESNVDIQSFLESNLRGKGSKAQETLRSQIEQALTTKYYGVSPNEATIDYYISTIEAGGAAAVQAVRKLKGKNTTADDIEAALNAGMNRINQVIEDLEKGVGEIITEDTKQILSAAGWTFTSLGDGQYVIDSVGNMVLAYAKIYEQMENTANHTTADLNSVYASLATALDQKNIDMRDTLTSAFDMSYDTLAQLINKYRPDILLKDVLNNPQAYGLELTGFGSVNIMDFGVFAQNMGWEKGSPQFLEYYSQYVDDLIETSDAHSAKALQEHAMENISAIADAKPGSSVNVAYLSTLFDQIDETLLTKIMASYGATLKDGILTLNANADIPAIIASVQHAAAQAEALLPEQIAELSDTLADFLANIVSLIKGGISGSLSNVEALDLSNWAKENGIDNLQFIQTAEGLQLTANSLADVYQAMKEVDALQAKSLLPDIQSANSEYSNLYSTLRSLTSERQKAVKQSSGVSEARQTLQDAMSKAITQGTVETDFYLRPHIVDEEGFTETFYSITGSNAEGVSVLVTPILPDGTKMSDGWAEAIAEQFANGEITLDTKLIGEDGKELQYTLRDIFMGMYDSVDAAEAAAEAYHSYHEAVMDAESGTEGLNNTLSETTTLMQDLVREMMINPDQFNFMSNGLPDGIQSVVNAFENAYEGINALTTANENGYMGVQDFYNVVTTASSLMEAAGQEFYVNGMTAAQLMEAAGNNLKVVDGKLTVDLSETGLDLVGGGVDQLKSNLKSGIDELAKAQIEMLDAEIQVLEVLAAMEEIGEVDVNGNGIAFEIDDIFETQTLPDGTKVRQFNQAMVDYLNDLEVYASTHEEVQKALESIKLGNKSMWELVQSKDWAEWQTAGFTEESLSQFLQTLTTMDWDVDNIQKQVADVLSGLSIGVSVELENGLYVFSITGEQFSFDWSDEETMGNAQTAIDKWWAGEGKTTQEKVEELVQEYLTGQHVDGTELTTEEHWKVRMTLALASGEITLKDEGDGTWSGRYKGKTFTGGKDQVIELIGQAMGYEEEGYNFEYDADAGKVTGKVTVGRTEIEIDDSGSERVCTVTGPDGSTKTFTGEDAVTQAKAFLATQGQANASDAGKSFTDQSGAKWNIYTDVETGLTYSVRQGDDPDYSYDGQHFDTYEGLVGYLQFRSKGAGGTPVEGDPFTITFESGLKMEYQFNKDTKTWETIYSIGGKEFKNETEAAKYMEATKKPGAVVSSDGQTVTYSFQGYECIAEFTGEGTVKYTMTLPNGTVTADNEASLKAAIAALINNGGSESDTAVDPITFTFTTTAGATVKVENGAVKNDQSTAGEELISQVKTNLETYLASNPAPVEANAEATSVTIGLAEGATVTIATTEEGLALSENIDKVTGVVDNLELTSTKVTIQNDMPTPPIKLKPENVTVDLTNLTPPSEDEVTADGKVNYAKGEVEKLTEEDTTATGIINWDNDVTIPEGLTAEGIITWKNKWKKPNLNGQEDSEQATGNLGLAKAQGTLMGELGPELVVSNGRYFVAGQNGPEMIDLAKDAIVFNHLQTKSLLEKGMSSGRGRAVTNERNAVSFATGNVLGGPAMASASAALAQLKALRSMWQSLLNSSVQDLAGLGGSGGGGGGGGGDKGFIRDLERWYDWLQKIAQLEKEITYEEAKRQRLQAQFGASGREYYDSQRRSLSALLEQMQTYGDLQRSQQAQFDRRRQELNNSAFSRFYTFDEHGQMHYQNGAFEQLAQLSQRNQYGEPGLSAKEQYERLIALNPEFKRWMQYNSNGEEIDQTDYAAMLQAFWDKVNSDKDEMQSLHDSIEDARQKMEQLAQQQYELLQAMKDNQMDMEQKIYDTIVDIRQRAIDELQDTKDAIETSNEKFIEGLNKALSAERQMYENAQGQKEIDRLRNKRDILVRSGGSASEIASLNQQIEDKEQSMYFDKQQQEIDAIQEASNLQIERLDQEIQLLTEVLEYQKKYGLLWAEVTEIMMKSPEEIANYIAQNNSEYWDKSPVATEQAMNDLLFGAEQWASYRDSGGMQEDIEAIRRELEKMNQTNSDSNNETPTSTPHRPTQGSTETPSTPTSTNNDWKFKDEGDAGHRRYKLSSSGQWTNISGIMAHTYDVTGICDKCGHKKPTTIGPHNGQNNHEQNNEGLRGFSFGGMNDTPGMAMLHGTSDRPEAIFNADQTRILRNNILGNRPESLVNLLKSYNDAYRGLSQNTYDSISNTSSTNTSIGRAEVNLNIDKLANDYDSRQAARTVMDEMLRIASKTSANNSVRR